MTSTTTHEERIQRAFTSLEGLSVGDAFGQRFFDDPDIIDSVIEQRLLPATPWWFTDDTQMALSIVDVLRRHEGIDQQELAVSFGQYYDSTRGYGPAMHGLMGDFRIGATSWDRYARRLFEGQGSYGNGAAMRVAPVGAYFADDMAAVVRHAEKSAAVTHTHPEGIAGAIAVAVAAAVAHGLRNAPPPDRATFLDAVLEHVPESVVRETIRHARDLDPSTPVHLAAAILGSGASITAADTAPFALWCAGGHLDDYAEALWLTVSGLGDRDTTCAIAGGIVATYTGIDGIPPQWRTSREPLPTWPFGEVAA